MALPLRSAGLNWTSDSDNDMFWAMFFDNRQGDCLSGKKWREKHVFLRNEPVLGLRKFRRKQQDTNRLECGDAILQSGSFSANTRHCEVTKAASVVATAGQSRKFSEGAKGEGFKPSAQAYSGFANRPVGTALRAVRAPFLPSPFGGEGQGEGVCVFPPPP